MKAALRGLAICMVASASACLAQDSLGDVARQQRFAKPAQALQTLQHEITNDDIASRPSSPTDTSKPDAKSSDFDSAKKKEEVPNAAQVQGKIRAQKEKVKALEDKIAADQKQLTKHDPLSNMSVYERVRFNNGWVYDHGNDCDLPDYIQEQRGVKDWCDEPGKLQTDIDVTQKQLDSERAILESMQEEARLQGFGNAIYDPD